MDFLLWDLEQTTSSWAAAAAAKSPQSCPTLCDPIDGSSTGSPVSGIFPGKSIGVLCHFLLQCVKVKSESEDTQSCPTLSNPMDCTLPSNGYIFPLLSFSLLFFSQLFVRLPQTAILLFFLHLFFLGMILIRVSCTMSRTSIHSSSDRKSVV